MWTGEDIDAFGLRNADLYRRFVEAGLPDGAADVARVEIVRRHGGAYADADSVALRPLREGSFMGAGFFACEEPSDDASSPTLFSNAFLGAVPEHPVLVDYEAVVARVKELRPMWKLTGPQALTDLLARDQDRDVARLPPWTFFATSKGGGAVEGGEPFAQHFWSTTAERWGYEWATPPERFRFPLGLPPGWAWVRRRAASGPLGSGSQRPPAADTGLWGVWLRSLPRDVVASWDDAATNGYPRESARPPDVRRRRG